MYNRKMFGLSLIFTVLLLTNCAFAQQSNRANFLNIKTAYAKLSSLNKRLVVTSSNLNSLKIGAAKLEILRDRAKVCVDKSENQLETVNKLLQSIQHLIDQHAIKKSDEYIYLQNKKDIYAKRAADCRFFVFRAQESIANYKNTIQKLTTHTLLRRYMPIWQIHKTNLAQSLKSIDRTKIMDFSGFRQLSILQWVILLVLLLIFTAVAMVIRGQCQRWLAQPHEQRPLAVVLVATIKSYLIPLVILSTITIFFVVVFLNKTPKPVMMIFSYYLLIYTGMLATISLIFSPPKPVNSLIHKSPEFGRSFLWRIAILGGLVVLGATVFAVFKHQAVGVALTEMVVTIFFTLFSLNIIWLCWLVTRLSVMRDSHKGLTILVKVALFLFLLAVIFALMGGYNRFAVHLISGVFYSLIAIGVFWLIVKVTGGFGVFLNSNKYIVANAIRSQLGLKYKKKLSEFLFIKVAVYAAAFFTLVLFLFRIWGGSLNTVDLLRGYVFEGFSIANLKVIPAQIIIALLVLGVLLVVSRWISNSIAKHYEFEGEKQTQVAIASIIGYIGFACSVIIALFVAGIDFTSIAVIAGALSVGVGLGLQGIVNNFVSGIILLLEKPVKPGDRVIVNGVEGFIKRIRIRSTQIETTKKEDIIVPNSDLITQQVTNFMFGDRFGRIACKVGVAYGSNIGLVKETLLKVTTLIPDVVQEEPNQPTVLFNEFGDSSLNFGLYCTVADVNIRYRVISDLNFAIDKAFAEQKIVIPFPQLDVHMENG